MGDEGMYRDPARLRTPVASDLTSTQRGKTLSGVSPAEKVSKLSPYVFPAPSGGYLRHPVRGIAAVRERSGVKDFRLHDVRRTVSQRIAEESGEGMSHSILGHARQRLGRTYIPNRPLKEQREGLEWWSGELDRVLKAETNPEGLDPTGQPRRGMSARAPRRARGYAGGVRGRVGRSGEVSIPKGLLKAVGLHEGDTIRFVRHGRAILIEGVAPADALMGRFSGRRLVQALETERRTERQRR